MRKSTEHTNDNKTNIKAMYKNYKQNIGNRSNVNKPFGNSLLFDGKSNKNELLIENDTKKSKSQKFSKVRQMFSN